jgi:hypothetical protein
LSVLEGCSQLGVILVAVGGVNPLLWSKCDDNFQLFVTSVMMFILVVVDV